MVKVGEINIGGSAFEDYTSVVMWKGRIDGLIVGMVIGIIIGIYFVKWGVI